MREIIINDNQLNDNDIESSVIRVKGLLINSKGKILLAHNNNTYQFPGGHVEEGETLINTVNREIQEETGMELNLTDDDVKIIDQIKDELVSIRASYDKCVNRHRNNSASYSHLAKEMEGINGLMRK